MRGLSGTGPGVATLSLGTEEEVLPCPVLPIASRRPRAAFRGSPPRSQSRQRLWFSRPRPQAAAQAPCVANATTLCLNNGRFKVQVTWSVAVPGHERRRDRNPTDRRHGRVLVLLGEQHRARRQGRRRPGVQQPFWVFYGALSDVAYTITVTDPQTGAVKTYNNPERTPREQRGHRRVLTNCRQSVFSLQFSVRFGPVLNR